METPVPALFMAHLFVFGCALVPYLVAVILYSPEPRRGVIWSWVASWVAVAAGATTMGAMGLGALAWLLWFCAMVGGIVVLVRAVVVRRKIRAGRRAAQLPTSGPLMW